MHRFIKQCVVIADEMSYFDVDGSEQGLHIYQDDIELANCTISNSKGLTISGEGNVSVQKCTFTRNANAVTWLSSKARLSFVDCDIRSNTYGIGGGYVTELRVSDCRFIDNTNIAFKINSGGERGSITIQNNLFQRNYRAIYFTPGYPNVTRIHGNTFQNDRYGPSVQIDTYETNLLVENNTFADLPLEALKVYHYNNRHKSSIIRNNTYSNIKGTPLDISRSDYANVIVEKNTFINNWVGSRTAGIYMRFYYETSGQIRMNEFSNNSGTNVVQVYLQRHYNRQHQLEVESNMFYDNIATKTVIATNTERCTVTGNTFSNALSPYDLQVSFLSKNLSAPYNWWGGADEDHVRRRIWDHADVPELGRVLYEPFLLKSEMPCDEVANCTGHGLCVRPNTCECDSGWAGSDCSQFSCVDFGDCQNRGVCVGPNVCDCANGWMAPDCVRASCNDRNNCSGHGICVGPNRYVSTT